MIRDIRDKPYLNAEDIMALNFVKRPGIFAFRRHYRQGLRSHVMEVLHPEDVKHETRGIVIKGLKYYPRAIPLKMLRIFRTKFETRKEADEELDRFRIVARYLAPHNMARSEEFLVTYTEPGQPTILLCGLQEYVQGKILDPWSLSNEGYLVSLKREMGVQQSESAHDEEQWIHSVRQEAESLVRRTRKMIEEACYVPDLAGVGNLLLTRSGAVKLVDINNISKVSLDATIHVDDRGYPVCDKSIQALSMLEHQLLAEPLKKKDPMYEVFLDPERMKVVQEKEAAFNLTINSSMSYVGTS
jgi:hypothetical protein